MFTVLSQKPQITKTLRRKVISEKVTYKKGELYLSRIVSRKEDNEKFIGKFINECKVPVILSGGEESLKLRYIIMLNTIIRYLDSKNEIAIFDPQEKIDYLLASAVKNFKTVYVVTKNGNYIAQNEDVLARVGGCAVIKERLDDINGCNYIISCERLPFSAGPYIFGEHGWFVNGCKPVFACDFPAVLPQYTDFYAVAAGIYKYMNEKGIISAYCTQFALKGVKMFAENFFK